MATATVPTTRPTVKPTTLAKLNRCDHFFIDNDLIIASATELGKLYLVTDHGCTCKASFNFGIKCWHQDARRYLIVNMVQTETTAGPRTPDEIDEQGDCREVVARPVYRAIRRSVDPEITIEAQMDAVRALGPRTYTQADYDEIT